MSWRSSADDVVMTANLSKFSEFPKNNFDKKFAPSTIPARCSGNYAPVLSTCTPVPSHEAMDGRRALSIRATFWLARVDN